MPLSVDIEKKIGRFRLQSRFEVGDETLGLLGASGCGKSMTLKCVAGVETPDRGKIVLDGRTLFDSEKHINLPARKRGTGYLFQSYALFPNMTVERNIACAVHLRDKQRVRQIVHEKIDAFYLSGLEKRYPAQLSGGQQQRVALARILAGEPRLLMLDEPFSALDSYLKWQLEQEVMRLLDQFRGPALFVSHNRDEVYRLCKRIVVMENGATQEAVPKEELFTNPRTLSAALLSGCKNISAAEKAGPNIVRAKDWHISLTVNRPVPDGIRFVGFRAHYFEPVPAAGENTVECEVVRSIDNLFSTILIARVNGAETGDERSLLRYELPQEEWEKLSQKQRLILHFPPDKLLLLQ